ncbi:MAG: SDR family oxidoreductase [Gammaproteobacteria bacterium]|nr:SDR family oxidoreductase [Gammaproteobacteria bacterium]
MSQVVFITGASSGFGEACARRFAESGRPLLLAARSLDKLQQLADALKGSSPVHVAALDVTDSDSIEQFFSKLPAEFSQIHTLVNNAGLALGMEPAYAASLEDWETMINTNVTGLVRVTREVLPGMVQRNNGHIINIGSTAGNWPYPGGNVYCATKSFVQQFSRALRSDLLGKQIRVTNIEPGMAETNFSIVRMKGDEAKADGVYQGTKPLVAEDIAEIIHWVTSIPSHININTMEIMPVCQGWGPLAVNRDMES